MVSGGGVAGGGASGGGGQAAGPRGDGVLPRKKKKEGGGGEKALLVEAGEPLLPRSMVSHATRRSEPRAEGSGSREREWKVACGQRCRA
jgi:hypothetical protein